jgi:hypothetical protein
MNCLLETITAYPLFRDIKSQHLAILAAGATAAKFNPGQVLFREGDPANQFSHTHYEPMSRSKRPNGNKSLSCDRRRKNGCRSYHWNAASTRAWFARRKFGGVTLKLRFAVQSTEGFKWSGMKELLSAKKHAS